MSLQHKLSCSVFIALQNLPHLHHLLWPILCSKRPWVHIRTLHSFHVWLFSWLHVERFQSAEVREFCLRLRAGKNIRIVIRHAVDAVFEYCQWIAIIYYLVYIYIYSIIYIYCIIYIYIVLYIYVLYIYIYMSDVPVKCWKFQRMFLRICYEIGWKFQNKNSTTDRYDLIYVLLFYVEIISKSIFLIITY